MSLDATTAWLLGEGDDPGPAARAEILERDLPPGLAAATLAAVEADRAPEDDRGPRVAPLHPRRLWLVAASAAAIAASALLSLDVTPTVGDPDAMVARGAAGGGHAVHLKAAIRRAEAGGHDAPARFRAGEAPGPGDLLYFRYQVAGDGWLYLLRQPAGDDADLLHRQAVNAGEGDLLRGAEPLAWSVDPGDPAAVFALVTAAEDHPDPAAALRAPGGDLCDRAAALGWRCDSLTLPGATP